MPRGAVHAANAIKPAARPGVQPAPVTAPAPAPAQAAVAAPVATAATNAKPAPVAAAKPAPVAAAKPAAVAKQAAAKPAPAVAKQAVAAKAAPRAAVAAAPVAAVKAPPQRKHVDSKNGGALTPPSRAKQVVKTLLNGDVKAFGSDAKTTVNLYKQQKKIVEKGEVSERIETDLGNGVIKKHTETRAATPEEVSAARTYIEAAATISAFQAASAVNKLCASQTIRLAKDLTPALNALGCRVLNSVVEHGVSQLGQSKMLTPVHLTKGDVDKIDVWPILRILPSYLSQVFATRKELATSQLDEAVDRAERDTARSTRAKIMAEYGLRRHRNAHVAEAAPAVAGADGVPADAAPADAAPAVAPAAADAAPADEAEADSTGVPLLYQGVSNHVAFCLQRLRPDQQLRVSKRARALLEHICKEIYESFALGMNELLNTGESKTVNMEHMRTLLNIHMHNGMIPKIVIATEKAMVPDPAAKEAEIAEREKAKAEGKERASVPYGDLPKVESDVLTRTLVWPDTTADEIWEFIGNSVQVYNDTLDANKKNRAADPASADAATA